MVSHNENYRKSENITISIAGVGLFIICAMVFTKHSPIIDVACALLVTSALAVLLKSFECPNAYKIEKEKLSRGARKFYQTRYLRLFGGFLGRETLQDAENCTEKNILNFNISFITREIERICRASMHYTHKIEAVKANFGYIREITQLQFLKHNIDGKNLLPILEKSEAEAIALIAPEQVPLIGTAENSGRSAVGGHSVDMFKVKFGISAGVLADLIRPVFNAVCNGSRICVEYQNQGIALIEALKSLVPQAKLRAVKYNQFFYGDQVNFIADIKSDNASNSATGEYAEKLKSILRKVL